MKRRSRRPAARRYHPSTARTEPRILQCDTHGPSPWSGESICTCGHVVHLGRPNAPYLCPKCLATLVDVARAICKSCFVALETQQRSAAPS